MLFKKRLFAVMLGMAAWAVGYSQVADLSIHSPTAQAETSFPAALDTVFQLLVFEGSDWCHNCQRLEQSVLSDSLFIQEMGKMGIALQRVDFPQRKKLTKEQRQRNEALAQRYGFDGSFPSLVLVRPQTSQFRKINCRPDVSAGQLLKTLQQSSAALE